MKVEQKPIFISHAAKDKALADKLVDLLATGCAANPNDILCTSLEGKGIPAGTPSFIEYLRKQIQEPKLVILLLSENFFDSQFCICELGAVWGMGLPNFPLVVPPLEKNKLKATLAVTQAGEICSAGYLDELRDVIKDRLGTSVPTPTWNVKRDAFLKALDSVLMSLPVLGHVTAEKFKEAQEQYQAALAEIAAKGDEVDKLKAHIEDLKKCKDAVQVKKVTKKYSSGEKQFEELCKVTVKALANIQNATVAALFYENRGEDYFPKDEDKWDAVREADDIEEIEVIEHFCKPRDEHPRVKRAKTAIQDLN